MPSTRIAAFEDETRDGCQDQVNAFLATIPLQSLMDIQWGVVPISVYLDSQRFQYWCMVIFREP